MRNQFSKIINLLSNVYRRMALKMNPNYSSLSMFLILLILLITASNYFVVNRTDIQLSRTQQTASEIKSLLRNEAFSRNSQDSAPFEYARQARKDLLEKASRGHSVEFYQKVMPEVVCKEKVRIGEKSDGGKYTCNPSAVNQNDCTIISLGLNNQILFDEHISKVTGGKCTLLGADMNVQNQATQNKYSKMNGQIFVGKIPDDIQLPNMMRKAGKNKVDLLKLDIEGGEHTGLEPLLKEFPVCQIYIEIHGNTAAHLKLLQMMSSYNFRVFNVDPNRFCATCCEYSLINEKCMQQYGAIPLGLTIPGQ